MLRCCRAARVYGLIWVALISCVDIGFALRRCPLLGFALLSLTLLFIDVCCSDLHGYALSCIRAICFAATKLMGLTQESAGSR